MAMTLAEETRKTLCDEFGVTGLVELIERDFEDISPAADVDREKAALYAERNRGSVRLSAGRFYTATEYVEHIRKVKALNLP
jgi:hypothetical protein